MFISPKMSYLLQEEKKRAALVERANKVAEEDLGWGDEEGQFITLLCWTGTEGHGQSHFMYCRAIVVQ